MEEIKPFIKWAGGKEKELTYIKENLPKKIDRYIEPFVGGGAVYFNMNIKDSYINDKSEELINLYSCIKNNDLEFYNKINSIYKNWKLLEKVVQNNQDKLLEIYKKYCEEYTTNKNFKKEFSQTIYDFVENHSKEFNGALSDEFNFGTNNLKEEKCN